MSDAADTGGPAYQALLLLTFVLLVSHFGGVAVEEQGLFTGGYNMLKIPFDVLNDLLAGTDAVWTGIIALLAFTFIIMPGLTAIVGENLTTYAILAATIALVTGAWHF